MARPRLFDEDRAVDAAMRAFWKSGYEATSTADLCAATGLGRSSIYNTFDSKRDLFEKSLCRYMEWKTASVREVLDGAGPVRDRIRALLWVTVAEDPTEPPGCLVVNSAIELAPHDARVADLLDRDLALRVEALRGAFVEGKRSGEIDEGKDPFALAHFVIATISGMRIATRAGADRDVLEAIANTALDAV